jgi:hypothetical protein
MTRVVGGRCARASRRADGKEQRPMLDLILVAVGLGFFAFSIAYAFGCDHL